MRSVSARSSLKADDHDNKEGTDAAKSDLHSEAEKESGVVQCRAHVSKSFFFLLFYGYALEKKRRRTGRPAIRVR